MKVDNIFQMNDWKIRKFLIFIFSIQLAFIGLIIIDSFGLDVSILRYIIGFIYLTFIPGILILRIFKLHKLGNIQTVLFAVGLSISFLMFTGFLMNLIYPLIGILRPFSFSYLIITISGLILVLSLLSYMRDKNNSYQHYMNIEFCFTRQFWFLSIIPLLAIIGSYLMNFYQNNIVLLLLIIMIAVMTILIIFNKISEKFYPYAIFIFAISLLYSYSLISMYVWGWDINSEFYYAQLVINNSIWDLNIANQVNAMLSVTMLAPIYSIFLNLGITWVFKVIYPFIFSLIPLGLYSVFKKYTDPKTAFLACFFFISLFTFYTEMINLARQEIAELFLVLLILLITNRTMSRMYVSILMIIFGISMIVSHYGLSYIFSIYLVVILIVSLLKDKKNNSFSKLNVDLKKLAITSTFIILFLVFSLTWYMYVSDSSALNAFLNIGNQISSSLFTDFLNPETSQGLSLIQNENTSYLHIIGKYLQLLTQFFILIGVMKLFWKRKDLKFEIEYRLFTYISILILVLAIIVPFFASSFNTTRLYQITLFFLAPFFIIGGKTVLSILESFIKALTNKSISIRKVNVLGIILIVFLLFNTSLIYLIANDNPSSLSITPKSDFNNEDSLKMLYGSISYIPEDDIFGAYWISKNKNPNFNLYSDYLNRNHVLTSYGMMNTSKIRIIVPNYTTEDSYTYLGYLNNFRGLISFDLQDWKPFNDVLSNVNTNQIYTNGECKIWLN